MSETRGSGEGGASSGVELASLVELMRSRRSVRHFRPDAPPREAVDAVLEAARWAPSGYNLQPTHLVVVEDESRRSALRAACMDQQQITEAPIAVVFCGDRRVVDHHLEAVIESDRAAGAIDEAYEQLLRKFAALAFSTRPAGLGWVWKSAAPLGRAVTPVPTIPAVHRVAWLNKQASLAAMNFMLAAAAAGLATCPMEGFDPSRVRKVIEAPSWVEPVLVSPLGYAEGTIKARTRLPADRLVHRERW